MKKYTRFILPIIFIALMVVLTGCEKAVADQSEVIKERGYVRVGVDDTFAPMGFRDKAGKLTGFDIDLARAVFSEMDLEVEFLRIDWMMKETELNNKTIDVIWNGYTITPEREEKVSFSTPYLENRQVIVVLANSTIQSKADLQGKEVGVQAASSSYDALYKEQDIVDGIKNKQPTTYATNDLGFLDLESGRIDVLVVDEILARYYISLKDEASGSESSKYRVLDDHFGTEYYGVGFRKNDKAFIDAFNAAFQKVIDSGIAQTISEDWFDENLILGE